MAFAAAADTAGTPISTVTAQKAPAAAIAAAATARPARAPITATAMQRQPSRVTAGPAVGTSPAGPAGPAIAEQQPARTAVAAALAGCAVSTVAAVADQPGIAALAAVVSVTAGSHQAPSTAVAHQSCCAGGGGPAVAVANQEAAVGVISCAIPDEYPDEIDGLDGSGGRG